MVPRTYRVEKAEGKPPIVRVPYGSEEFGAVLSNRFTHGTALELETKVRRRSQDLSFRVPTFGELVSCLSFAHTTQAASDLNFETVRNNLLCRGFAGYLGYTATYYNPVDPQNVYIFDSPHFQSDGSIAVDIEALASRVARGDPDVRIVSKQEVKAPARFLFLPDALSSPYLLALVGGERGREGLLRFLGHRLLQATCLYTPSFGESVSTSLSAIWEDDHGMVAIRSFTRPAYSHYTHSTIGILSS